MPDAFGMLGAWGMMLFLLFGMFFFGADSEYKSNYGKISLISLVVSVVGTFVHQILK